VPLRNYSLTYCRLSHSCTLRLMDLDANWVPVIRYVTWGQEDLGVRLSVKTCSCLFMIYPVAAPVSDFSAFFGITLVLVSSLKLAFSTALQLE